MIFYTLQKIIVTKEMYKKNYVIESIKVIYNVCKRISKMHIHKAVNVEFVKHLKYKCKVEIVVSVVICEE